MRFMNVKNHSIFPFFKKQNKIKLLHLIFVYFHWKLGRTNGFLPIEKLAHPTNSKPFLYILFTPYTKTKKRNTTFI